MTEYVKKPEGELLTLVTCVQALDELDDEEARHRVLAYITAKYADDVNRLWTPGK